MITEIRLRLAEARLEASQRRLAQAIARCARHGVRLEG